MGPTKYPPEYIWNPRNTDEKNCDLRNTPKKIFLILETPTTAQWHDSTRPTRPTIVCDPRNLAHSNVNILCFKSLKLLFLVLDSLKPFYLSSEQGSNGPHFCGNFFLTALRDCLLLKTSGSMNDFWESLRNYHSRGKFKLFVAALPCAILLFVSL